MTNFIVLYSFCILNDCKLTFLFAIQFYLEEGDAEPRSKVRLVVPNSSCGGIIGKGGATIKYEKSLYVLLFFIYVSTNAFCISCMPSSLQFEAHLSKHIKDLRSCFAESSGT